MDEQKKEELKEKYFADTYGLDYVEDKLWGLYSVLRLQRDREEKDFTDPLIESSHFVIVGARGTGKTMIGNIISCLLCDYGIREERDEVSMQAREILQAFYADGEAAIEKLIDKVEDNRTLIVENFQNIFLDLNYEEVRGRRICVCLDRILKKKKDILSVIITMDKTAQSFIQKIDADFFDNLYDIIELEPYSIESLLKIAEKIAYDKGLLLRENAEKSLFYKIDQNYRSDTFMNAISIRRYLDEAVKRMADRYYKMEEKTEEALVELRAEDFETSFMEESLEELLAELDSMVGLDNVKKSVHDMVNRVRSNKLAREKDANSTSELGTMHLIFTGNPGTGKTTVARMIGKIYQQLGVLPRGHHTVECTRGRLIGQYLGETAQLVQQRFLEAEGGVLFLDEAYAICRDDQDSFGQEAVDELTPQIENHRKDTMVILAGYSKAMEKFLDKNEGLHSRFRTWVMFKDYTVDEMISIFYSMVKKDGRELASGTEDFVKGLITVKSKMPDFGNARGVRNVYEEVLIEQANRIQEIIEQGGNVGKELFDVICREDIEAVMKHKLPGEKTLEELLGEMAAMPGLQQAKKVVYDQINRLQYQKIMKKRNLPVKDNQGTMHMLFKGNAGTGKTTMARIIAQIYQRLGILKKNTLLEVKRADLVSEYLGQSAIKTLEVINRAEGGVLFIDEAYDLVNNKDDYFGMEALNALVADLENRRGDLVVIMAGYGEDLDQLMQMNQGLESRFPTHVYFEDYSVEELSAIFFSMLRNQGAAGLKIEGGVEKEVYALIERRRGEKENFGNARGVRNIIEAVRKNMEARVIQEIAEGKVLDNDDLMTIRRADLRL